MSGETGGETPARQVRSGPNQGCELASHDHIASYTNPIVPALFSTNFFSPPSLSFPFLLVSGREVASLCVKLLKVHLGDLNKLTRAQTFDHLILG